MSIVPNTMRNLILLTKMMEECGQLIQECSKILLYGENRCRPDDTTTTNKMRLQEEMGDVLILLDLLAREYDIDKDELAAALPYKAQKVEQIISELTPQECNDNEVS